MIHMFDAALNMLGLDTKTLLEILEELRQQHIQYGVKAHYYPFMGQALVYALKETIGTAMMPKVTKAWIKVYELLSGEIMKTILIHS